jgi:hypothetical protein
VEAQLPHLRVHFFLKKKVHIFKRHGRRNISSKMGENVRERKQME